MVASKDVKKTLVGHLRELHLPTFRECFEAAAGHALQETLSYEQYLLELAQAGMRSSSGEPHREACFVSRSCRWKRVSTISISSVCRRRCPGRFAVLSDGGFVDRAENLLAFGKSGSGKTHLLCGIAQELVRQGRKVYFSTCSLLVQDLLVAKRDLKLSRVLKRLSGFDALLIDDIGYVQQSREEMEVLFTLLAERYERGTVMLTSNLAFSKWEAIFKDPMTTAAAIDRLVHHSVILELNIPSYRLRTGQEVEKQQKTRRSKFLIESRVKLGNLLTRQTEVPLPRPRETFGRGLAGRQPHRRHRGKTTVAKGEG